MKTILIAGGGYADIPMIRAAKRLGYRVITSGNRPEELGHRHSDLYEPGDFSDGEAMLAIARRHGVAAVCSCCNDFSALSCAYVAERLGLPGHDPYQTALTIHHKDRYRAFALANGVTTPRAVSFDREAAALAATLPFAFPVLVKPVDLTGGKGIGRADSPADYASAVGRAFAASRAKRVVVEEFIVGTRHGWSAFLRDGKVVFAFADNEHYHLNPYLVSAASTPAAVPATTLDALTRQAERIAGLWGLRQGIFHVQYILRGDEPVIIEICRRPPGDLYVTLVEHATGVDYPSWIVRSATGDPCPDIAPAAVRGHYVRHCVMGFKPGRIHGVQVDPTVEELIVDRMMWWRPGDAFADVHLAKAGIVFLRFPTEAAMTATTPRLQELIRVETL